MEICQLRISLILFLIIILFFNKPAKAETNQSRDIPKRPTILSNRWEEDWSVLANPQVPREPFDSLKYIPLSTTDPKTYLSLGANLRNRYEYINAINFGVPPDNKAQSYVITRMEAHADLRIANQVHIFAQLQNDLAPGKTIVFPVDKDKLDLEQAFILITEPVGTGIFRFRGGRQQMAFDLQRFVSIRDGPNVRLSFDAVWADYTINNWKFISFYSRPVQTLNVHYFDDYSTDAFTFSIFRFENKVMENLTVSFYLGHFKQDNASYATVSGNERRDILDVRFAGTGTYYDWELEAMGQIGNIANKNIRAWALGSTMGYTFANICLQPRVGLQVDLASGNQNQNSKTFGTFNPLFPNGYYFTLANYTSYANLIHIKPSLTVTPSSSWNAMFAIAAQWRQSTADAVYVEPHSPIPNTAGLPGYYTGTYFQTRINWQMTPHIQNALEIAYFKISNTIRRAGGHDSIYIGIESKFGW